MKSDTSSDTSSKSVAKSKLPKLVPQLKNGWEKPSWNRDEGLQWTVHPVIIKTKIPRKKTVRRLRKRPLSIGSKFQRKTGIHKKLPRSDGDSEKTSTPLTSSDTELSDLRPSIANVLPHFVVNEDVSSSSLLLLPPENDWPYARRTPTVRTRRGDALKRVNSNKGELNSLDYRS